MNPLWLLTFIVAVVILGAWFLFALCKPPDPAEDWLDREDSEWAKRFPPDDAA